MVLVSLHLIASPVCARSLSSPTMNQLITFDEAAGFLKNPPSVMPHPDFTKIRAIQTHITKALKQLDCPQSLIHGWSGLAMDPTTYVLTILSPFVTSPWSGPCSHLSQYFAAPQVLKTINKLWENREIIISHTLTSAGHASACSMKTSPISSKCPTALIWFDGTPQWVSNWY